MSNLHRKMTRRKGPRGRPNVVRKANKDVQKIVNKMTNWQRKAWSKAGATQDLEQIRAYVSKRRYEEALGNV